MWYSRFANMRSRILAMQEVRLTGRYDARSLGGLAAFSNGMMMAFLHHCGHSADVSDWLQIARSSSSAIGPSSFRNAGAISSGPGAPLRRILLIADFSSSIVKSGTDRGLFFDRISRFSARLTALSFLEYVRLLTDA